MRHNRIISSVILAGALLTGCLFSSAAEIPGTGVEIVEIEEIPGTSSETANTEATAKAVEIFETEAGKTPETTVETESETEMESAAEARSGAKKEAGSETKDKTEAVSGEESARAAVPGLPDAPSDEAAQGLFEIACFANDDFVLDVRHCTVRDTDGKVLQAFRSLDVNQQKFYLETLPGGQFRISALHTGDALTALPDGSVAMSAMEHPEDRAASPSQSWIIEEAQHGGYFIRTKDGQYLTLDSIRPCAGTPIVLRPYTGGFSQIWKLDSTWVSADSCADTDLVDPYGEDGPCRGLRLSFIFGDNIETITADDLSAHISENGEHQLVLDAEYLDSFVAQLAVKYDTQGLPKCFRTSYGNEITLYEGDFGWKLDTAKTRALIESFLNTNQVRYLAPAWAHKGWTPWGGGDDVIGDSYVEVDLLNQKVFLYKDGKKLLETECVSGTESDPERKTPGGVYSIYRKVSPDTLDGPGYSEFVNYWMPFFNGFGLHDATWRAEFGGEIYKNNGSHGCINLPLEDAELIYNTVDIGYPVVLYR